MGNLATTSSYIYRTVGSGVEVYDVSTVTKLNFIQCPSEVTSLWANDSYVYVGTTASGIYSCPAVDVLDDTSFLPYKSFPDITSNNITYLHGGGDYLCITTSSGVDQYDLNSSNRIYTTTANATTCCQTNSGSFYYVTNPFVSIDGLNYNIHNWEYVRPITFSGSISVDGYQYEFDLPIYMYDNTNVYGEDIRFLQDNGKIAPHYIEEWESHKEFCTKNMPTKSIIIDAISNFGGIDVGLRSVEFYLDNKLIELGEDDITASASSYESSYGTTNGLPWEAFVTSLPKIGSAHHTSWQSDSWSYAAERLICVFKEPIEFDKLVINNFHSVGGDRNEGTNRLNIYISDDTITDTTYNAIITGATKIFEGSLAQHVNEDVVDDQLIDIKFEFSHCSGDIIPKIHVKCDNNVEKLYLLYGNDKVSSTSSAKNVFDLYDDFSGDVLDTDLWEFDNQGHDAHTCLVDNNKLTFSVDSATYTAYLRTVAEYPIGTLDYRLRYFGGSWYNHISFYAGWADTTKVRIGLQTYSSVPHKIINIGESSLTGTKNLSTSFILNTLSVGQEYQRSEYDDEILALTDNISYDNNKIFFSYFSNNGFPSLQIDRVRLRRFMQDIPSFTLGEELLVSDIFSNAKLCAVYDNSNNWQEETLTTSGHVYTCEKTEFFNPSYINELFVTEDTSTNGGNCVFVATTLGAFVIEEKRGDEAEGKKKLYLLKT